MDFEWKPSVETVLWCVSTLSGFSVSSFHTEKTYWMHIEKVDLTLHHFMKLPREQLDDSWKYKIKSHRPCLLCQMMHFFLNQLGCWKTTACKENCVKYTMVNWLRIAFRFTNNPLCLMFIDISYFGHNDSVLFIHLVTWKTLFSSSDPSPRRFSALWILLNWPWGWTFLVRSFNHS